MEHKIHLMCGFIGFGKTTLAKELEREDGVKRFSCDDYLIKIIGNKEQGDISAAYEQAKQNAWNDLSNQIKKSSVSFDGSLWTPHYRNIYNKLAIDLVGKENVVWHHMVCDMELAKQRVFNRNINDESAVLISDELFEARRPLYQPITKQEGLNEVNHIQAPGQETKWSRVSKLSIPLKNEVSNIKDSKQR